ncbi:hypothetical protein L0665_06685 [Methanogenium marinum]|uniref:Uncharacterized protein n=1 Tax=Methanogenium marinum TaxID=348610 RepID=A0A9Q4KVG2_9EURY|nr:hypothetical protein [Methanogenium marinum]MDE4908295.1 hypothetical protein [Methanogenium marinum]
MSAIQTPSPQIEMYVDRVLRMIEGMGNVCLENGNEDAIMGISHELAGFVRFAKMNGDDTTFSKTLDAMFSIRESAPPRTLRDLAKKTLEQLDIKYQ